MNHERVRVDREAIRRRLRWMRSQESSSIGLRIVLPGLNRFASTHAVAEALGPPPTEVHGPSGRVISAWTVYPTEGGSFLWITDAAQWEELVSTLTRNLGKQHAEGIVTAPVTLEVWEMLSRNTPSPAALLAFPLEPGIEDGPVNVWGRPAFRWGVPVAGTDRAITESVDWAAKTGTEGVLSGGGPSIPACANDAEDLIRMRLEDGQHDVSCTFVADTDGGMDRARCVAFNTWGQVAYLEVDPDRDPVSLAEDLETALVRNAAALEVGAITLVRPTTPDWGSLKRGSRWLLNRHLWSTRVHDAHGIQLLTSAHLDQAHDLSNWQVSEVATNRYLVRAEDLAAWYAAPDDEAWKRDLYPTIDTMTRARADFGDMILTEEIAEANPLQIATH